MTDTTLDLQRLAEISAFARERIAEDPATAKVAPAELQALVDEVLALRKRVADQREGIDILEKLRPHWAQGYSSDSVAAQAHLSATLGMWDALGVDNQTDAIERIRDLLAIEQEHTGAPAP